MANAVTPAVPAAQTVAVLLPVKTPLKFTSEEFSTWAVSAGTLPEGLVLEVGPGLTATIVGIPAKAETQTGIKVEATAVSGGLKGTNSTAFEIKVVAAKFSALSGSVEVITADSPTGAQLDKTLTHGTEISTSNQAEIAALTSQAFAAVVERTN